MENFKKIFFVFVLFLFVFSARSYAEIVNRVEVKGNERITLETIVNASNEVLVSLFLTKKIGFLNIVKTINKIFRDKDFTKYARRKPETIKDIQITDNWARLKTLAMCVR